MANDRAYKFDVFISHNAGDKPRARKLAEKFRSAGLRVWFDEWEVKPGDDIFLAVERGLENSRVLARIMQRFELRAARGEVFG